MPQTVPNRPTNGPAEATVARNSRLDFEPFDLARDRNVEHFLDARVQAHEARPPRSGTSASIRAWRRRRGWRRRRSAAPTAGHRAPRATGRTRTSARSGPSSAELAEEQSLVDDDRPAPEGREQQPTMTNLTTRCAVQNMSSSVVSGVASACVASAGFMGERPRLWRPSRARGGGRRGVGVGAICAAIGPKLGLLRLPARTATFYVRVKPSIGLTTR